MASSNASVDYKINTLACDTTERYFEYTGGAENAVTICNVGSAAIMVKLANTVTAPSAEPTANLGGELYIPAGAPAIPLPRGYTKFYHKAAAATALLVIVGE